MAKIEEYYLGKNKYYRVTNLYIGVDEITGKKKYKGKSKFTKKAEAQLWIANTIAKVNKHGVSDTNGVDITTFEELYNLWIIHQEKNVKASSLSTYKYQATKFVLPDIGSIPLKKLSTPYLQTVIHKWHSSHPNSVRIFKTLTSQILKYGVILGVLDHNPITPTLVPRTVKKDKLKRWTKDQLIDFLNFLGQDKKHKYKYVFFSILAYAGLRRGEALALEWGDIDFIKGTLTVNKTVNQTKELGKYINNSPKTQSSIRTISIDKGLLDLLFSWRTDQLSEMLLYGFNTNNLKQRIFTMKRTNDIIHPNSPTTWLGTAIDSYNKALDDDSERLPYISPHGFRHTHASLLIEAGVPIKEVSDRLGHADVKLTLDIYNHITKTQEKNASDLFSKYMQN
ncbi:site-specific integrase [Floricoccus penangensis]|uniref:site-specific integrase n=1 Tax=Floricoccus penangensis TaxID=1859475 RepID=UPI00203E5E4F|nr:site-specific integrase [Floricoccus penangensis]URZ87221.1 site-specific integrase [Floricoccus penangensis]